MFGWDLDSKFTSWTNELFSNSFCLQIKKKNKLELYMFLSSRVLLRKSGLKYFINQIYLTHNKYICNQHLCFWLWIIITIVVAIGNIHTTICQYRFIDLFFFVFHIYILFDLSGSLKKTKPYEQTHQTFNNYRN